MWMRHLSVGERPFRATPLADSRSHQVTLNTPIPNRSLQSSQIGFGAK